MVARGDFLDNASDMTQRITDAAVRDLIADQERELSEAAVSAVNARAHENDTEINMGLLSGSITGQNREKEWARYNDGIRKRGSGGKDTTFTDLAILQSQYHALGEQIIWLQNEIENLDTKIAEMTSRIDELDARVEAAGQVIDKIETTGEVELNDDGSALANEQAEAILKAREDRLGIKVDRTDSYAVLEALRDQQDQDRLEAERLREERTLTQAERDARQAELDQAETDRGQTGAELRARGVDVEHATEELAQEHNLDDASRTTAQAALDVFANAPAMASAFSSSVTPQIVETSQDESLEKSDTELNDDFTPT